MKSVFLGPAKQHSPQPQVNGSILGHMQTNYEPIWKEYKAVR